MTKPARAQAVADTSTSVMVVAFPRHTYSIARFSEELATLGVSSRIVSPADLIPILRPSGVETLDLDRPDGVIHTWWGARGAAGVALRAWERIGTVVANPVAATQLAADKFLASAELSKAGLVQLPIALSTDAAADERVARSIGFPLVVKPVGGSSGRNTHLVHDLDSLRAAGSESRPYDGVGLVIQPFVAEARAVDRRIFVLEDRVLATIERIAASGDFRSNVAQGGLARAVEPTGDEATLAVAATRALGLDYAGVDVIGSRNGPIVLEVNAEPQFEALEATTGANVAGALADWLMTRLGDRT